jgi:phage shock protein A
MAESLSARVARLVAASANALLEKLEDQAPRALMTQAIHEVDLAIDDARAELGLLTANRHLAAQQSERLRGELAVLEANTKTAISAGRDDWAEAAVSRTIDIEAQLPVLGTSIDALGRKEDEIQGFIRALAAKKREMNDALQAFLATQTAGAAALGQGVLTSTSVRAERAGDAFDRIYERETGLTPSAHAASLDQADKLRQLDDLARRHRIEERLAKLKGDVTPASISKTDR